VERTFAWLGHVRRLVVRYERLITTYAGSFHLACALLTLQRVLKWLLAKSSIVLKLAGFLGGKAHGFLVAAARETILLLPMGRGHWGHAFTIPGWFAAPVVNVKSST
jgi:hypothetical protein